MGLGYFTLIASTYKTHRFSPFTGHLPSREGNSFQRLCQPGHLQLPATTQRAVVLRKAPREATSETGCWVQKLHCASARFGLRGQRGGTWGISTKSFQTTSNKITPQEQTSKPQRAVPAQPELSCLNGRISAGGSSAARGLQPTPPDPCPFCNNRQRLFLPSVLSRAPLKQREASAPSSLASVPSQHCTAPLNHFPML